MKRFTRPAAATWLNYIRNTPVPYISSDVSEHLEYLNILNRSFLSLFYHSIPMVYLLDYTSGKYLTMSQSSKTVLGHDQRRFVDGGVEFTIDNYEPRHLELFNSKIFPDRLSVLKSIPVEDHRNHIFTYYIYLRNSKREYLNLLQRNIFIESDKDGNPLLSLGMVINIDHVRWHNPNIQLVEKLNVHQEHQSTELIFRKSYFLNEEDQLFTRREKEVLLWLAEGLTSKQIADKLSISEGTVIIHRKRMLEKSGALNIAALISFAIRNRII